MIKKDLFKSIIEQNSPDKDDILTNVLTKPATNKNPFNFKRIAKYALPAVMVSAIIFAVPVLTNRQQTPENNNRFSLVAYAADIDENGEPIINDTDKGVELQKNVKIDLSSEFILYGTMTDKSGFKKDFELYLTNSKLLSLKIDGENIKSINIKCETGMIYLGRKKDDGKSYSVINGRDFTCKKEDFIHIQWEPIQKTIAGDTITITVTFNDGEQITQIAEITIDGDSGDVYVELRDK